MQQNGQADRTPPPPPDQSAHPAAGGTPVGAGISWIGFVGLSNQSPRGALGLSAAAVAAHHAGEVSYAELDASIQGWINHVRHSDSWGLRHHVLETLASTPPNIVWRSRPGRKAARQRRLRHVRGAFRG